MLVQKISVEIQLLSPQLGTLPKNPQTFTDHVASKAIDPEKILEEVESLPKISSIDDDGNIVIESTGKGETGFAQDQTGVFIWSHMIKGFIKSSVKVIMENNSIKSFGAYKKWVDLLVDIVPKRIYFINEETGSFLQKADGCEERSLRVNTPQGERVCLSKSDHINSGRILKFNIKLITTSDKISIETLAQCFEYGQICGLGQWRGSGGMGQFKVLKFIDCGLEKVKTFEIQKSETKSEGKNISPIAEKILVQQSSTNVTYVPKRRGRPRKTSASL